MALKQILSKAVQVTDSRGNPLGGGYAHFFEPGGAFSSRINIYADSGLNTQLSNPIRLSGSGRQTVWINRDCDMRITDRNGTDKDTGLITGNVIIEELNVNPDILNESDGSLISNGSFETDTDSDGTPDNWTRVNNTGSNNGIDTSESTDGGQSFRFTSTGNGGGSLTTTDFFPVNDTDSLKVTLDLRSTVADVRNIVKVEWYDISQVSISNTDVYDNALSNPTTFTSQSLTAAPPSGARFAKLKLIGCDSSDSTTGSTYFDNVMVFYPTTGSGVFDNLSIQNNEIISTNTNGNIELDPNGTGKVDVQSALDVGGNIVQSAAGTLTNDFIRTVAANSGGLEINNTSTGGGFERALTLGDLTITTGTFTPTWSGFSLAPSADLRWFKMQNVNTSRGFVAIVYESGTLQGTSNSVNTSISSGSLPTEIRPSQNTDCMTTVRVTVSNTPQLCLARIGTSGAISFYTAKTAGDFISFFVSEWNNSGSKGLDDSFIMIYPIS